MNEETIINEAIENLKLSTGLTNKDIALRTSRKKEYDYELAICGQSFACEVKPVLNKATYGVALLQAQSIRQKTEKPLLLVASEIARGVAEKLQSEGINTLDSAGNCIISASPLYVRVSGRKTDTRVENNGKAFNEAGLKLIFYFLLSDRNIKNTYRKISEETGLSLGTIKNVIDELRSKQFVISTQNGRALINKKRLLDIWQTYYNQKLKPKLKVKDMEFADAEIRKHWQSITLPEGTCWGGEGAAYLLDHYLTPERFDIYTDAPSVKLMMTKKLLFQDKGSVHLYKKFWKQDVDSGVAPVILAYADLMGSGNGRCVEAAQRLIENKI